MKRILLILIFTFICVDGYSQNLDLIVNTRGDSLACRIDSITDTHIYFEMKFNSNWFYTYEILENIASYEYEIIEKRKMRFKPGTSYIKPYDKIIQDFDAGKNTIYLEMDVFFLTTVNYERRFSLSERTDLALSAGFGNCFNSKLFFLLGGPYQHFEIGVTALMPFYDEVFYGLLLGYRFQGKNGFLVRGPLMFFYDEELFPLTGFSLGFSF